MININGTNIELILAPMAEITDAPFRIINKLYGADLVFTQMVSARGIANKHFDTLRYAVFNKDEKPIGIQLLAENIEFIDDAISEIKKLKPDVIDLNASCPANDICNKGLGAKLLEYPDKLYKLLDKIIITSKSIPVSVKLRLGYENIKIFEILDTIKDLPLKFITIHARKKSDFYSGIPYYDIVKKVKDNYEFKIVFNASCFSLDDYITIKDKTNADAVMIARGALGNPFIFKQIKSYIEKQPFYFYDKYDILNAVKLHAELIYKEYGPIIFAKMLRKYLCWYFMYFENFDKFVNEIYKIDDYKLMVDFLECFVENNCYLPNSEESLKNKNKFQERVLFWLS
jgi:tRNA-dihydrouridine synthase B